MIKNKEIEDDKNGKNSKNNENEDTRTTIGEGIALIA